ncbi:chloride channel protein, CIC family [Mucilaginibacter mallensis]|uniref:Chloride channel protein, CIC family n=1 Tax=Mucilaginibacter mallensis TaxID=652787 RepID=A0A1H2AA96_MUCMA|nr:chloride channel protein [Mucilaginibacter mallensis]SDT42803.1 chloride channel protein, CIC family [Mucilaginibacter mallensis]
MRKAIIRFHYFKLIIVSIIVAVFSILLADSLKKVTGFYEDHILQKASNFPLLFVLLPTIGITAIYFLRKYLFKGKANKGIKEIYQTIENRRDELPAYKIPSHYFNGFLTVIFGGSTGIEVSTVVATAAIGSAAYKRKSIANIYKTELICAGVAAGVATLFGSPLAGFLFAVEVIAKKLTKTIFISCACSALIAWGFMFIFDHNTLFNFTVTSWNFHAVPYLIILSILSGFVAVYFTKVVIFLKDRFGKINNNFIRVNVGAILVGLSILCMPQLYGDSYHAIPGLLNQIQHQPFTINFVLLLLAIVILKPVVASLTLGAGGDGGVFAPSIVSGAVLGMLFAVMINHFFNTQFIVLNFALVGAASALSAAIHAPLTSAFLTCSLVPGGYVLFIPIIIACFIAKYSAQFICSYTVYSYKGAYKVKLQP